MITAGDSWQNAVEKGIRCERVLLMTLAEMYAHGVFTRKVAAITQLLWTKSW